MIGTPFLRAGDVAARHGVTHQGAMLALRRLAQLGVLDERTRNGRVVFAAPAVIRLLAS